jgi:hypothetical protein
MSIVHPRRLLLLATAFCVPCLLVRGQSPTRTPGLSDLDPAGCSSFQGDQSRPAEMGDVAEALGLSRPGRTGWSAGKASEATTFHYRIGFRKAVALGAVFLAAGQELRVLRPQAAYPGDPADKTAWLKIDAPDRQGGGALVTLPPQYFDPCPGDQ